MTGHELKKILDGMSKDELDNTFVRTDYLNDGEEIKILHMSKTYFADKEKKNMKTAKKPVSSETWIMWGNSESGDSYPKKKYDHKPTEQDKRDYIVNETDEELPVEGEGEGPGDFGSYVYLTVGLL